MMTTTRQSLLYICVGVGLTLIAAGLFPFANTLPAAFAQDEPLTTPESAPVEATPQTATTANTLVNIPKPTGNNSYCLVCHNQPWRAVTLQDGYILNLYVDPRVIEASVHGSSSASGALGCVDCHGEDSFPHNSSTPTGARDYALKAVEMCYTCHQLQADDLAVGLHEQAILAGNKEAAVCTDCHGAHAVQPGTNQPQLVAGVCGTCHVSTYNEWRSSAHVDIGPLGCAKCHSPHSQELRVGSSDELCLNCHKAPSGIYAHTQHISSESHPVQCVDCHMYRTTDVLTTSVALMPTGHTMLMDTRPCNSCHEQLEVTGKWSQIIRGIDTELISQRDSLQARVSELESKLNTTEPGSQNIQLVQGLIAGLGLGITIAIVVIPRALRNHRREENGEENDE
jgi:formate-dependent nitrite reductase cytochrome c552 subunit